MSIRRPLSLLKYALATLALCAALIFTSNASDTYPVIVLDPGHGGYDPGATVGIRTEAVYDLLISQYVREYLEDDGRFVVYLTRDEDVYLKFLPRALVGLEHNADFLLSIHCNSNTESYVNGSEVYMSVVDEYETGTMALMNDIMDRIATDVGIRKRKVNQKEDTGDSLGIYYWNPEKKWDMPGATHLGQKSDYYSMLTWSSKFGFSSAILECGFLSNPTEREIIDKDENLRLIARCIADALIEHYYGHEHTFSESHVTDLPSSCTLDGTASLRCTYCGLKKDTTALPESDEHYWRVESSKAATCDSDGYINYVCQISYNLKDKGYNTAVHRYTETLPKKGHNYVVIGTSGGVDTLQCTTCHKTTTSDNHGDNHTYSVTENTPATCKKEGRIVETCTVCGDTKIKTLPKVTHKWVESERVYPTPEEDGYVKYTCTICSDTQMTPIPKCDHKFTYEKKEPTCTESGYEKKTCSVCGYVSEIPLDKLPHESEVTGHADPTCEAGGFTEYRCKKCGEEWIDHSDPTGHSYSLTKKGMRYETHTCAVCGGTMTVEREDYSSAPIVIAATTAALAVTAISSVVILKKKSTPKGKKYKK